MWKRNGTMNRVVVTDLLLRLSAVFVHLWNVLFWIKNWILVAYNLCVNSFMSRITVIPLCRVNGFVWLVFVWYNFSRSFFLVNNHEFPPPPTHPPTHPSLSLHAAIHTNPRLYHRGYRWTITSELIILIDPFACGIIQMKIRLDYKREVCIKLKLWLWNCYYATISWMTIDEIEIWLIKYFHIIFFFFLHEKLKIPIC